MSVVMSAIDKPEVDGFLSTLRTIKLVVKLVMRMQSQLWDLITGMFFFVMCCRKIVTM